jgi:hypothetical protein
MVVCALALKVGHDPDADRAVMIVRGDAETEQTVGQATVNTTGESSRPLEGMGRAHKLQSPRAANEAATIAALPLGRSALPPPESTAAPINPADVINYSVQTPVVADQPGPSAPAPKKVRKPPHRNGGHDFSHDWRWPDDQWNTRAYALPDSRYRRDRYERPWGWSW